MNTQPISKKTEAEPFQRTQRYHVAKIADIKASLTDEEQAQLWSLMDKLTHYRQSVGKPTLKCLVIESDWPEYELSYRAIEARVSKENKV